MKNLSFSLLPNEYWWGGAVHDGAQFPLSAQSTYHYDFSRQSSGNQTSPFFVSTCGRSLWSEKPFVINFDKGNVTISGLSDIVFDEAGGTLREAYLRGMKAHFPFTGVAPEKAFYVTPQFSTWVELRYDQSEDAILSYAESLLKNGFAPGVLMIDDTWQENYGVWNFSPRRFRDPKGMIEKLHNIGFSVMLWVVPLISPDSREYREALKVPGTILLKEDGEPLLIKWWNGYSAAIDLAQTGGRNWMHAQLNRLMEEYHVDGFKFDGGGVEFYRTAEGLGGISAAERNLCWFNLAAEYRFNEVKDTWKAGGKALNQRLRDKSHSWEGEGLACILPDAINAGLTGIPYLCPDMVGGGEWSHFEPGHDLDEELIVRCAQVSAIFPMMQFSVAPWRVLSKENCERVLSTAKLHEQLGETLYDMVKASSVSGEPILAPLCYWFPSEGLESITDEVMLGSDTLIAPVLHKGETERKVILPTGTWLDENDKEYAGGQTVSVPVTPDSLPIFKKQ